MWYWRQTNWNEYTLMSDEGHIRTFITYYSLYYYCKERGIDAQTA